METYTRDAIIVAVLAGVLSLLLYASIKSAYGSEVEIIHIEKETIVFLTGNTCETDLAQLTERLPDYFVVCAYKTMSFEVEPNVAWARMHYSTFEEYFYVIYVQSEYYQLTDDYSVAGITFNGADSGYAISIGADFVIEHEREHLVCKCYKTPDGHHG